MSFLKKINIINTGNVSNLVISDSNSISGSNTIGNNSNNDYQNISSNIANIIITPNNGDYYIGNDISNIFVNFNPIITPNIGILSYDNIFGNIQVNNIKVNQYTITSNIVSNKLQAFSGCIENFQTNNEYVQQGIIKNLYANLVYSNVEYINSLNAYVGTINEASINRANINYQNVQLNESYISNINILKSVQANINKAEIEELFVDKINGITFSGLGGTGNTGNTGGTIFASTLVGNVNAVLVSASNINTNIIFSDIANIDYANIIYSNMEFGNISNATVNNIQVLNANIDNMSIDDGNIVTNDINYNFRINGYTHLGINGYYNSDKFGALTITTPNDGNIQSLSLVKENIYGWFIGYYENDNSLYITDGNAGVKLCPNAHNFSSLSDERCKKNINKIPNSLEKIEKINGVYYNYKNDHDNDKKRVGLIAQEVLSVLPEAVDYENENVPYSVRYTDIIPLLVNSIHELKNELYEIKNNLYNNMNNDINNDINNYK